VRTPRTPPARPLPREAAPPGAAPARRTAPAVHSGRVHRDRPRARRLPAPWGLPAPRLLPAVRDRETARGTLRTAPAQGALRRSPLRAAAPSTAALPRPAPRMAGFRSGRVRPRAARSARAPEPRTPWAHRGAGEPRGRLDGRTGHRGTGRVRVEAV